MYVCTLVRSSERDLSSVQMCAKVLNLEANEAWSIDKEIELDEPSH